MEPTVRRAASTSSSRRPASGAVTHPASTGGLPFRDQVAALSQDPAMRSLALRYAHNRDLAEDALQETCYAIMKVRDPARIDNLPSYFRRVLQRKVVELLELSGPLPTDDPDASVAASAGSTTRPGTRHPAAWGSPSEDRAVRRAQSSAWLARLTRLAASVPGRSADPQQYRRIIAIVTQRILPALLEGEVSWPDVDQLLIQAYPEWFAAPDSSRATYDQRLSRGRRDVRSLLASVVDRDELMA
jgi:DNA-directed RNA polymerase specialized sigma24 family protein